MFAHYIVRDTRTQQELGATGIMAGCSSESAHDKFCGGPQAIYTEIVFRKGGTSNTCWCHCVGEFVVSNDGH